MTSAYLKMSSFEQVSSHRDQLNASIDADEDITTSGNRFLRPEEWCIRAYGMESGF